MYAWGVFLRGAPGQLNPVPQSRNTPPDFAMIIVMIIVLAIILLFCFWGAPGIRAYCRRKICYRCPMDEPRDQSAKQIYTLRRTSETPREINAIV
ncbi:hypothetical protein QE152_g6639 [Popillia japonica]|uniref:Uncharacterized protein n=1 Tax=Popillia japonica TaxID=7064 RepID=A0AAW1MHW5_POPJA